MFRYPFVNLSFHCILLSKITPDTRLHPPHPACTLFLMSSLHHFILFVAALTFSFTNPLHFMIYLLSSIRLSQTLIFYTYRFLKVLHLPNTVTSLVSEFQFLSLNYSSLLARSFQLDLSTRPLVSSLMSRFLFFHICHTYMLRIKEHQINVNIRQR